MWTKEFSYLLRKINENGIESESNEWRGTLLRLSICKSRLIGRSNFSLRLSQSQYTFHILKKKEINKKKKEKHQT